MQHARAHSLDLLVQGPRDTGPAIRSHRNAEHLARVPAQAGHAPASGQVPHPVGWRTARGKACARARSPAAHRTQSQVSCHTHLMVLSPDPDTSTLVLLMDTLVTWLAWSPRVLLHRPLARSQILHGPQHGPQCGPQAQHNTACLARPRHKHTWARGHVHAGVRQRCTSHTVAHTHAAHTHCRVLAGPQCTPRC